MVEKFSKYKDIEIEVARTWKLKTEAVPIVVIALVLFKRAWKNTSKQFLERTTLFLCCCSRLEVVSWT